MVCNKMMGLDSAVAAAAAGGHLQMKACKPLIGFNLLQSTLLLSDAILSFRCDLAEGLEPDRDRIQVQWQGHITESGNTFRGWIGASPLCHEILRLRHRKAVDRFQSLPGMTA